MVIYPSMGGGTLPVSHGWVANLFRGIVRGSSRGLDFELISGEDCVLVSCISIFCYQGVRMYGDPWET